ncbi:ATP-binding protein [Paenibacillus frigoriresistens]|uniref:ATP-binding protein n=1 Tax=Paenibacillus alginolyticus TaxID=59839 RepID=UPI001563E158|nr:DUF87 domain-containing protein [Paenibacillus frigoriresistens]NRF93594.1 ATP-binding protein [Paenibacillus frigoriresistens]
MTLSVKDQDTIRGQAGYFAIGSKEIRAVAGSSKMQRPPSRWTTIREIQLNVNDKEKQVKQIRELSLHLIYALSALKDYVFFRIHGTREGQVSLSIGVGGPDRARDETEDILRSVFPQVRVEVKNIDLDKEMLTYTAFAVGIPRANDMDKASWQNLLLSGCLGGEPFTVIIAAAPITPEEIHIRQSKLHDERDRFYSLKSGSASNSIADNVQSSDNDSLNVSKSTFESFIAGGGRTQGQTFSEGRTNTRERSEEYEHAEVVAYIKKLDRQIERLEQGMAEGMWQTALYFCAQSKKVINVMKASLTAGTINEEGLIHPYVFQEDSNVASLVRKLNLPEDEQTEDLLNGKLSKATAMLTSCELACLTSLPEEEFNGYSIEDVMQFSVNPVNEAGELELGHVLHRGSPLNITWSMNPEQLTKHALITGITGSGKTNTIFGILQQMKKPFLVVEPVKREYRHLSSLIPDLRVYSLGNENISPFRLNPFYFPAGYSLQQHIDSLKAIFMASFSMYASMPNILEQCLQTVYLKQGWSLHYSTNIYEQAEHDRNRLFPTLQDLYYEVDDYLQQSGYAEEQKSNIRAALLTRLKSLIVGGKGLLLNTREVFDFAELLTTPTVLELEGIADEDDKALVMGLLFIRLAEQLKVEQPEGQLDVPLRHITVVEEAHRVFSNQTPDNGNTEVANIKGKSVEYFSNLLSEIRSMGEGMLIVDQIPNKLAPDAVKNTNLKIVHRLVSIDDSECMCNALGLKVEHAVQLARLKKGEALVFQEGMSRPVHLCVSPAKEKASYIFDDELAANALKYNPFLTRRKSLHPFAEIMIQDDFAGKKIIRLGQRLYRAILFGPLDRCTEHIREAQDSLLKLAYRVGLDVPIHTRPEFITSITEIMIEKTLRGNPYYSKISRIRDKVEHFMKLILHGTLELWSEKELKLLELRRSDTIYPLLIESYERVLSELPTATVLFIAPSAVDGEAYIAAEELASAGIMQQISNTNDKFDNVNQLIQTVRELLLGPSESSKTYNEFIYKTLIVLTQKVGNPHLPAYLERTILGR